MVTFLPCEYRQLRGNIEVLQPYNYHQEFQCIKNKTKTKLTLNIFFLNIGFPKFNGLEILEFYDVGPKFCK